MATSSPPVPLPQTHHYIRFSINPPSSDALHVRRALQEALVQSFGAARSHTYLDILWVADLGTECVVRTGGPTYVCASPRVVCETFNSLLQRRCKRHGRRRRVPRPSPLLHFKGVAVPAGNLRVFRHAKALFGMTRCESTRRCRVRFGVR